MLGATMGMLGCMRMVVGVTMRMVVGMGMPVVVRMLMGHRMQVSRRMVRRLGAAGVTQRLGHDLLDRTNAAPASLAAAEAAIDLAGGPCIAALGTDSATHVMVSQHIAGTNDHGSKLPLR
ncbi:hypothetical protein OO17_07455 [Rhodopseudomonas palustris]|uniref:Uncharacterized protein n=1 Tax=Rhodopseudomonas palustris TaxID=1076 RepID=A0A0D7F244_RHOPL|nr:hypothetical protein OO17_07455 [Rhodopseudomonas palustris]